MPLPTEHILMPAVRDTLRQRNGPKPTLNYLEVAYLKDLSEGKPYSLIYSPAQVQGILWSLINKKLAHVPYEIVDKVRAEMVVISDYGAEVAKG